MFICIEDSSIFPSIASMCLTNYYTHLEYDANELDFDTLSTVCSDSLYMTSVSNV